MGNFQIQGKRGQSVSLINVYASSIVVVVVSSLVSIRVLAIRASVHVREAFNFTIYHFTKESLTLLHDANQIVRL